jgi:hypothetical protein
MNTAASTASQKLAAKVASQSTTLLLASLAADSIENPKTEEAVIVRVAICDELDRRLTAAQNEVFGSLFDDENWGTWQNATLVEMYTFALATR